MRYVSFPQSFIESARHAPDVTMFNAEPAHVHAIDRTEFSSARTTGSRAVAVNGDMRPTLRGVHASPDGHLPSKRSPARESASRRGRSVGSNRVAPEVARIAYGRVVLLAARCAAAGSQAEITARLEILNRRLLEQAPRISEDQVRALEEAEAHVMASKAAREERFRRLGLS